MKERQRHRERDKTQRERETRHALSGDYSFADPALMKVPNCTFKDFFPIATYQIAQVI